MGVRWPAGTRDSMGNVLDALPAPTAIVHGPSEVRLDGPWGYPAQLITDYLAVDADTGTSGNTVPANWILPPDTDLAAWTAIPARDMNRFPRYYGGDPRTYGYQFIQPPDYGSIPERNTADFGPQNQTVTAEGVIFQGGADPVVQTSDGSMIPTGAVVGVVEPDGTTRAVTPTERVTLEANRDAALQAGTALPLPGGGAPPTPLSTPASSPVAPTPTGVSLGDVGGLSVVWLGGAAAVALWMLTQRRKV